ncbi:hypothetical protein [Ulvibacterium sp.]|uniref:hypothetical protein n=1 Tax=Ulvibacterium sp. TaxID=2665914 RepID=UPI002620733C|nr:hypothetical protein [Ulvibacterium sp.]
MNNPMLGQVHLAAQYLAMAGKTFLPPKADDSHTNIGFMPETETLETLPLHPSGQKLVFDYSDFSLKWESNVTHSFPLDGKSHNEVVAWINAMVTLSPLTQRYVYELHYELPYSALGDFKFELADPLQLQELLNLRKLGHVVLRSFLERKNLTSDICIWPHHFDTGAFSPLNDGSGKSVGLGLAIPDSLCDEHYFYISGYLGNEALDVSDFNTLTHGTWDPKNLKGALLPVSNADSKSAVQFFEEALRAYKR